MAKKKNKTLEILNVKFTSWGENRPCVLRKWERKELAPFVHDGYLTENIGELRQVVEIIHDLWGRELIITKDGFEFFDGNY